MSKKSTLPQSRRHVMVYDEDWEFLTTHFGASSESQLGPGTAVRELVHKRVLGLKAEMQARIDALGAGTRGQESVTQGNTP